MGRTVTGGRRFDHVSPPAHSAARARSSSALHMPVPNGAQASRRGPSRPLRLDSENWRARSRQSNPGPRLSSANVPTRTRTRAATVATAGDWHLDARLLG